MHENEITVLDTEDNQQAAICPLSSDSPGSDTESAVTDESIPGTPPSISPVIPKPIFMRLLMLFGGGIGCLLVGIIVTLVTGDMVLLAMSAILGIAFVTKGFLLRRKINIGQIYSVAGVCVKHLLQTLST